MEVVQHSRFRTHYLEVVMEFLKSWRMPQFTIPTLVFPLGFYYLFGIVLSGVNSGGNVAQYLLATFGVFGAMGPSLFGFGVGIAMEEDQGLLEMKRVFPMPVSALVAAKLVNAIVFTVFVMIGLYSIGVFFGGVHLAPSNWVSLASVHILTTLPFSLLGLTIGILCKGQGALAITNIVFMLMSVLGGLWMPITIFPEIAQKFAVLLPSYHLGELALHAAGSRSDGGVLTHIFVIVLYVVILSATTTYFWRRKHDQ